MLMNDDVVWSPRRPLESVRFEELRGETLVTVAMRRGGIRREGEYVGDHIELDCMSGRRFLMFHEQDCCESVTIEDVCGEIGDLLGRPLLIAEEVSNSDQGAKEEWDESYTWTFYKLATIKGGVTIRWYGTSNGYYSESVDFYERKGEQQ